jgi:integrase
LEKLKGSPEEMSVQVLNGCWVDRSKKNALDVIYQYAEFVGTPIQKSKFRAYSNQEMYVPNPEMVKRFLYRVHSVNVRARIRIAVETGASSGEVWRLEWRDFNAQNKTLTVIGNKGHRTLTYNISDELMALLLQIPRKENRIFAEIKNPDRLNDVITDYFKTKDIVETQRFARHCNINNTLKYVHIVKSWIKSNEFNVVYAEDKVELTKYLSEGYSMVTKTDWGFCLTKPKTIGD